MKKIYLTYPLALLFLAGCFGATNFSNRSVVYQVEAINKGEHSYVSESPKANDANVNADKVTEANTKLNGGQSVIDSSETDQSKNKNEEPKTEAPKTEEAK